MSLEKDAFEALVPSRFITFTFPNPSVSDHSNTFSAAASSFSNPSPSYLHTPLLRVAVLDSPTLPTTTSGIAAILVPRHRETDWIFSTVSGHLQLLLNIPDVSRLVLIGNLPADIHPTIYNRPAPVDQLYRSKTEEILTPLLLALSPKLPFDTGLPETPFLSYEDDVIRSVILERCVGSCVGEMLVEDVELERVGESGCEREFRRRLRFKRMPNLIQTQIRIVPNRSFLGFENLGELDFRLDMANLVHPYLTPMVASLSLINSYLERRIRDGFKPKALCLGVGGGALLTFLNKQLGFEVVGVDSDEVVLRVAREHFGLQESIRVCVGDGIKLTQELAGQTQKLSGQNGGCSENVDRLDAKFDVIMVDLDSSDAGIGTMAPPMEFVQKSVLFAARLVLSDGGILIVNVIPPSKSFYETLVHEFQELFQELYEVDVGNGENFVLIATPSPIETASCDCETSFLTKLKLAMASRRRVENFSLVFGIQHQQVFSYHRDSSQSLGKRSMIPSSVVRMGMPRTNTST
ncbi:hypothetical protein U1Q18_007921 [Sarracenia purpurea var. burkii]